MQCHAASARAKKEQAQDHTRPSEPCPVQNSKLGFTTTSTVFPASIESPATHKMATCAIPAFQHVLNKTPDKMLLEKASWIAEFFRLAIRNGLLTPTEVEIAISTGHAGSSANSHACFSLVQECIDRIASKVDDLTRSALANTQPNKEAIQAIEHSFEASLLSEDTGIVGLSTTYVGVYALSFDIFPLESAYRNAALQLIQFCGEMSFHDTPMSMLYDDIAGNMLCGDGLELNKNLKAELINAYKNSDGSIYDMPLSDALTEEAEYLSIDLDTLALFFQSQNELPKTELTRENVKKLIQVVDSDSNIPDWISNFANIILKHHNWTIDTHKIIEETGYPSVAMLKPIGVGSEIELECLRVRS